MANTDKQKNLRDDSGSRARGKKMSPNNHTSFTTNANQTRFRSKGFSPRGRINRKNTRLVAGVLF